LATDKESRRSAMWSAQMLLVNGDICDDSNLLVRKTNTIIKGMEVPLENIKEVVKINTEKTKQFLPYLPQGLKMSDTLLKTFSYVF
jgi:pyruvate-formate lyase-activating enzyme